jgi:hypothetical protein
LAQPQPHPLIWLVHQPFQIKITGFVDLDQLIFHTTSFPTTDALESHFIVTPAEFWRAFRGYEYKKSSVLWKTTD